MRVRRAVLVLTTVAFAIAAPLGAGAAASSSSPVSPDTGSIAGTVVDVNGSPLVGVCVQVWDSNFELAGAARSRAGGVYAATNLRPGTYTVEYDGCNLPTDPNIQAQFYDNTQDYYSRAGVAVSAGDTVTLNPQTLQPGGEIRLRVLGPDGRPVPDLQVQVQAWSGPPFLTSVGYGTATPDANGYVDFQGLLPFEYQIQYYICPGGYCYLIGYYHSQSLTSTPTLVTPEPGVVTELSDTIDLSNVVTSTTTLTPSSATITTNDSLRLKASITASDGSTPTGWIEVMGATFDSGLLQVGADGIVNVTTGPLPVGKWTFAAWYWGGGEVAGSTGTAVITVQDPPPASGGGGGGVVPAPAPVSGTVSPGGSLSSDPAGTTLNASNPLVVGVTSPSGGAVSIDKTAPNTSVAHYSVLNVGATITAPGATVSNPLKLSFEVFDGQLPQGSYASDLTVFRDGTPIGACTKAGTATPDPCVTSTSTSGGVTTINILSSHASTWDVEAAQVGRIAGADRIGTAVAVSQDSFPAGNAAAVVLARADDYPDALVGAPLAAAKNAPLLLTQGAQLPKATSDEIKRVLPGGGTVFVLGGTVAVPDSVVDQLKTAGFTVVREAGADRYATAVAVANEMGDPTTVLLATGTNFPDALAAGPAAAHLHGAVLLTAGSVLPKATSSYLAAHASSTTYAVGGPAAKADPAATALVGADRFATAATVATTIFASPATVGIATGQSFPDALSGGAQLARADAPLLLAANGGIPRPTSSYLTSAAANLQTIHVFGGPNALTDSVITELQALTN